LTAIGRRIRLIEYAGYREMIRRIGYGDFAREWPRWRSRVRGERFRASLDFLADWIQTKHPELMIYGSRQSVLPQSTLSAAR
jgi:pimeloyl-ACP methyl ester carboxylesterase